MAAAVNAQTLHARIGALMLENDSKKEALTSKLEATAPIIARVRFRSQTKAALTSLI